MDLESLKGVLWMLPVALAFFWLMRRGACGGMAHEHGRASSAPGVGHSSTASGASDPVDPVCGMKVDPGHVAGTRNVQGREYSFCSPKCLDTFDENPAVYVRRATGPGGPPHRHGCC